MSLSPYWPLAFHFSVAWASVSLSLLWGGYQSFHTLPDPSSPALAFLFSCRMIAAVDTDSPREVFFRVASEMFSDGNFNWGRVVALFYFACKLVLKVGSCRAVSPRRLPSDLPGLGSHEINPCGSTEGLERDSYGPLFCYFIHLLIQHTFIGPTVCLAYAWHPGCSTKQLARFLSRGAHIE